MIFIIRIRYLIDIIRNQIELKVCQECKRDEKTCKEKGKRHKGVNADFILYISSVHSEHCESSNTVAYSAYCQLESKYNRLDR